jgi:hypothetical protein
VEIATESAEAFLAALGPGRTLENGIRVTPLDGPPAEIPRDPDAAPRARGGAGRRPHAPGGAPKRRPPREGRA